MSDTTTAPQGGSTESQNSGTLLGGGDAQQQQSQTFTPSYDGIIDQSGTFADGWTAKAFGPDYTGPLANVKDVGSIDKMLRDTIAMARSRPSIAPPKEGATPEQIAQWRQLTGAPENLEGYGDVRPETIPPELWDKDAEKALLETAHKHHLPPAAIKDIIGLYAGQIDKQMKETEAQFAESRAGEEAKLKQAWGEKFGENLRMAQRFALTLGFKPDNPIFNNAETVLAMARGAQLISEDKLVNGQTVGLQSGREQAQEIMTNPQHPLYQKYQTGDPNTVALVNNMLQA